MSVAESWDEIDGDDCPDGTERSGEVEFEKGIDSEESEGMSERLISALDFDCRLDMAIENRSRFSCEGGHAKLPTCSLHLLLWAFTIRLNSSCWSTG